MEDTRRPLSPDEQREVRFWVDALLQGKDRGHAADELYSIGIRTRGAIRTRGSVRAPAPPRFPQRTLSEIAKLIQTEASPEVRAGVAAALGEWGGKEALEALKSLIVGEHRETDKRVRGAAIDAIGIIGGPDAMDMLREVSATDDDPTLRSVAQSLLKSMGR